MRCGGVKPNGVSVTPKPSPICSVHAGEVAEQHLGRRAVRPALAEVVLDGPDGVEAELVGEPDLLDRLAVGAALGVALAVRMRPAPWLGRIHLVQDVEFHEAFLPGLHGVRIYE